MTRIFKINGVDYGPLGNRALVSSNPEPSGPDKIGQGTANLIKAGGGYDIRVRHEVEDYEWNGSAITRVHYAGFVGKRDTDELLGAADPTKTWSIPLQDQNLLLATLVGKSAWAQAIRFTGASYPSFAQQVAHLVSLLQTGASKTIDATSQVVDLVHTGMPDQFFQGKSLYNMLLKLCADAVAINPALRPRFYIGPDLTVPRATFGGPVLYVYDAASPPVPTMSFSDSPTGLQKTIFLPAGHLRSLDGASLVNWRQGIHQSTGAVYTASDATSISTYPNPYDPEGAWKAEPIVTTEAVAGPDFQAKLNANVAATAYPRETLTITTDAVPPPLPGQWVEVTLDLEGLSNEIYQVAASRIEFPGVGSDVVRSTLELGLPKLLLGDDPTAGSGTGPPVEGDAVPPDTPGSFTLSSSVFNWTTGLWDLTYTWAASTAGDLDPTDSYLLEVLVNGVRQRIVTALLTALISVPPAATYAATVTSKDTSHNYSAPSATLSGTAAAIPTPSTPTWPTGTTWIDENAYDPATNTTRVRLHWNANAGGDHIDHYRVVVADGATRPRIFLVDNGLTGLTLPAELPNVYRAFNLTAINKYNITSSVSATVDLTTDCTVPPSKTLYNPEFEIPKTDDPTVPDGWTPSGGTIVRDPRAGLVDTTFALKLLAGTNTSATSRPFQVEGGATFVLTYLSKSNFTDVFTTNVYWYDASGTQINTVGGDPYDSHPLSADSTWTKRFDFYEAPATAASARIEWMNSVGGSHTLWIDSVEWVRQAATEEIKDSAVDGDKLAASTVEKSHLAGSLKNLVRAYSQTTNTVSAPEPTSDTLVNSMSATITLAATSNVRVSFCARCHKGTAGDGTRIRIKESGTILAPLNSNGAQAYRALTTIGGDLYFMVSTIVNLAAGSHTLGIYHQADVGTSQLDWYDRELILEELPG